MTRYFLQPLMLPLAALALAAVLFAIGCDQGYLTIPGHDSGADHVDASPDAGASAACPGPR